MYFAFFGESFIFFIFFGGGGGIAKCLPKTSCANMVPHNMSEKTFNFIKIICFRLCLYQMRRPCCWSLEYVTFLPWAQSAQTQSCTDSTMKISRRWILKIKETLKLILSHILRFLCKMSNKPRQAPHLSLVRKMSNLKKDKREKKNFYITLNTVKETRCRVIIM